MTSLISCHAKCTAKRVGYGIAMLAKPITQPVHASGRKFGNRIAGTAGLGSHDRDRIPRSTRSGLCALQYRDRPAAAGELACKTCTGNAGANDDDR